MSNINSLFHGYNARANEKIKDLLFNHGLEGYGIFWSLCEDLFKNGNMLKCDYKRIAYDLRTDEAKVKSVINDFGLFKIDEENYFKLIK